MENQVAKIVVAGNATLDAIVYGDTKIDGSRVTISSEEKILELEADETPIMPGDKVRVNQNLGEMVRILLHRMEAGGGGVNSIVAMRRIHDSNTGLVPSELELLYMDVSNVDPIIMQRLRNEEIDSHHYVQREVPINLILNYDGDKIVLKGPQLGRVAPLDIQRREAERRIIGSDALLINSVKDPGFVEAYIQIAQKNNVPVYFVVTTSLDWDFVKEKVLPAGTSILNYDELPKLKGSPQVITNAEAKMEYALDALREMLMNVASNRRNAYVTLGKNGVYCSDGNLIYHVKLNDEYAKRIEQAVLRKPGNMNGAGDVFAAAVVLYEMLGKRYRTVDDIAKRASIAAIKGIGYRGHLPLKAFTVNTV